MPVSEIDCINRVMKMLSRTLLAEATLSGLQKFTVALTSIYSFVEMPDRLETRVASFVPQHFANFAAIDGTVPVKTYRFECNSNIQSHFRGNAESAESHESSHPEAIIENASDKIPGRFSSKRSSVIRYILKVIIEGFALAGVAQYPTAQGVELTRSIRVSDEKSTE